MKQYQHLLCLGILGLLFLPPQAHAVIPSTQLKPAVQLYREGRYHEALKQLHKLEDAHPEDARAPYYKALCQVQLGAFDKASLLYRQVLLLFPNSPAATYAKRGLSLLTTSPAKTEDSLAQLDKPPVSKVETLENSKSQPQKSNALSGGGIQQTEQQTKQQTKLQEEPSLVPLLPMASPPKESNQQTEEDVYNTNNDTNTNNNADTATMGFMNEATTGSKVPESLQKTTSERGLRPADVGLAPVSSKTMATPSTSNTNNTNAAPQGNNGMSPQMMQQMMMMSMMGGGQGGGGGNGSNPMVWMMPMMMQQGQNGGQNAGQGNGEAMDPEVMSQMLMNNMMSGMDFGLNTKKDE